MPVATTNSTITLEQVNNQWLKNKRLGKAQAKSHPKMLQLTDYAKANIVIPEATTFWKRRAPFPAKSYGNRTNGCCTRASQAAMAVKLERLEQRRTIEITEDEVLRVYYDMTARLYEGGDTGAYELDALGEWRKPDLTFRDTKGRPHTIDAFVRVNNFSNEEIKKAIFLSEAHGIKVCFNLPWAWSNTLVWDIPAGQQPIGKYQPGSWGGHSMTSAEDYDKDWCYINHTWFDLSAGQAREVIGKVSWRAMSIYCDESYMVIDSINAWKKRIDTKNLNLNAIKADVNLASSQKIK